MGKLMHAFRAFVGALKEKTDESFTQYEKTLQQVLPAAAEIVGQYHNDFVADDINPNLVREILPVMIRGNNQLRSHSDLEAERQQVAEEVTVLLGKLDRAERKKAEMEQVFLRLENADVNTLRSYCLFNDPESGDILLLSGMVNAKNMTIQGNSRYPAAITIHTLTNDVQCYDVFDNIAGSGDYPITRAELEKKVATMLVNSTPGADSVAALRDRVFDALTVSAYQLQQMYDEKNAYLGTLVEEESISPYDRARELADSLAPEDGITVLQRRFADCICLRNQETFSSLSLWYNEEGITGAYFTDASNNAQRVYDVREYNRGFLELAPQYQAEYHKLLRCKAMSKFLEIEGMDVSYTSLRAPMYWIGSKNHSADEVLQDKEPRWSDVQSVMEREWQDHDAMKHWEKALTKKKEEIQRTLREAEGVDLENDDLMDIEIDCNPYNHSLGFTRGDERVVVIFNHPSDQEWRVRSVHTKDISNRLIAGKTKAVENDNFRYGIRDTLFLLYNNEANQMNPNARIPSFYDSLAKACKFPPYAERVVVKEQPKPAVPVTGTRTLVRRPSVVRDTTTAAPAAPQKPTQPVNPPPKQTERRLHRKPNGNPAGKPAEREM